VNSLQQLVGRLITGVAALDSVPAYVDAGRGRPKLVGHLIVTSTRNSEDHRYPTYDRSINRGQSLGAA
jgi:hypothetical protein